jgi:hypothetical protein
LNNRLAALAGVIQSAEAGPTRQSQLLYEELASAVNVQIGNLKGMLERDLDRFNKLAREKGAPPVVAPAL